MNKQTDQILRLQDEAAEPPAVAGPVQRTVRPDGVALGLVERLRFLGGSVAPSPMQMACNAAAAEIERLLAVLERIGAMDPATDSIEGYNEWGEADCFRQAQNSALRALGPNV